MSSGVSTVTFYRPVQTDIRLRRDGRATTTKHQAFG
jgi:hypothetical protein